MQDGVGAGSHPNPHDLERFLLGELPPGETRAVTVHLMRGCPQCRGRMAPLAAALFGRVGGQGRLASEAAIHYDEALTRAFTKVGGLRPFAAPSADSQTFDPPPEDRSRCASARERERCEALLDRCIELRHRDPEALVLTATLAVNLAERLDGGAKGNPEFVDLRARSWAELGNSLRIAGDLSGSESALARSLELATEGSGDLHLLARQMDLAASLLKDRRRFDEATALLHCVREIYESLGDEQAEGRALISQGITATVACDPERAAQLLQAGLRKIDPERDPQLALASVHSLIWCLVECGDLTLARRLFAITRALYAAAGGPLIDLRAHWLEAKIAAGLGDEAHAEGILRAVRGQFEAASLPYDAALVTLDLVEILLRRGIRGEIAGLLEETAAVFRAQKIGRETLATLVMLRESATQDQLSTSLLRHAARELRERSM